MAAASAGDKDWTALASASVRIHGLRGQWVVRRWVVRRWVVRRRARGAELDRRLLQADALDVGHSASGNENVAKSLDVLAAIRRRAMNCDAVPVAAQEKRMAAEVRTRKLLDELLSGLDAKSVFENDGWSTS
jgi:hypothetical protein